MTNGKPEHFSAARHWLWDRVDRCRAFRDANPGTLVAIRIGDYFEFFEKDAETAARALGVTLLNRTLDGVDVLTCGCPVHAAPDWHDVLVGAGLSAIWLDSGGSVDASISDSEAP